MKVFALVCALLMLLIAAPLHAQAATTMTLIYDYGQALPAEVATYTQTLTIDGVAVAGLPNCAAKSGSATDTTCSIPIPPLATGSHVISILAAKGGSSSELRVTGLNPSNAPKSATGVRVVVTTTITVP